MNTLTKAELNLYRLLDKSRDLRYYSYSLESILSCLHITKEELIRLGRNIEHKLGKDYAVNIFEWSDVSKKKYTFVGFEYRRKDYERDEIQGRNLVTKYIQQGVYS